MESPYFFHPFGFETPFLALVVAFYGFYKRYLGIFEILSFLAIFGARKVKNSIFLRFFLHFLSLNAAINSQKMKI